MKAGIRQPEELLRLAFARDTAKEMSDRMEECCGVSVETVTFHALAYDIIGTVEGRNLHLLRMPRTISPSSP